MYYFPLVCCICNSRKCDFKNVNSTKDGDYSLIEKLEYCVPDIVAFKSPCSAFMCNECHKKLNVVYEFKQSCIKTHKILHEYAMELDANEHENSELQVEVELTIKNEPLQIRSPEEELITVYRVEVIKELDELEENELGTRDEDILRNDLSQVASSLTSYPDSEYLSESVSMAPDNFSIFDFDSELGDEYDNFVGFTNDDIESSSVVSCKTKKSVTDFTIPADKKIAPHINCKICGKTFKTATSCKYHEKSHEDIKPNICLICMQVLSPHMSLKEHLLLHYKGTAEKACNLCDKTFPSAGKLYYHKMVHHEQSSHECKICNKHFVTKLSLTTHYNTHFRSEKDLFSCKKCDKKFITLFSRDRHFQVVHEQIKPFICHLCGKGFGMKHYLKRHLDCHTGLKLYECMQCGKCFRYQESLTHHLKIHKKYKCPLCDESFMTFKMVREHERQHRSDLPYHCNFCSKNFKLASHLSNHISHKHGKEISTFFM